MPILPLLGRFWYAIPIVLLLLATWYYKSALERSEAAYAMFKAQVEVLGEQALLAAKRKEAENAQKISDALVSRNAAYKRLRDQSTSPGRVSLAPATPEGSNQLCFDPASFNAAIERYRRDVRGLVGTGDEAQIDARSLLESWPR